MQQQTTVYRKYVNQNDQSVKPPLLKMREIALPTLLRIDTPEWRYLMTPLAVSQ